MGASGCLAVVLDEQKQKKRKKEDVGREKKHGVDHAISAAEHVTSTHQAERERKARKVEEHVNYMEEGHKGKQNDEQGCDGGFQWKIGMQA